MGLLTLLLLGLFGYSLEKGSSRQLVRLLVQQSFPFEAVLLEGIPGFSAPERDRLEQIRGQGLSLGMFLLTGVNVSDARTYFFSYFMPPPDGPAWIGWAYNSRDPEFEGEIAEGPQIEEIPLSDPNGSNVGNTAPISREVLVGIFHTHNGESYAGDGGAEREKGNGEIVTVGEALKNALIKNRVQAVQSQEIHDAEDFMKAYSKSVNTASKLLKDYPSLKFLLDVHRDGLLPGTYKSTVQAGGKEVSRVMIVIGKKNPHWEKNAEIAQELIARGEKKYPGLFNPEITYAEDARYNQHLANGAMILEIGSQLNTFEEAKGAAELVAEVLADWLKENPKEN